MKKNITKPQNIKDEVDALAPRVDDMDESLSAFDALSAEFDRKYQELEAMELGIEESIDTIECEGQEELAKDAIDMGEDLDELEAAEKAVWAQEQEEDQAPEEEAGK